MNKKQFQTEYGVLIVRLTQTKRSGYQIVFKLILSEPQVFAPLTELGAADTTANWFIHSPNKRKQRRGFNCLKFGSANNLAQKLHFYTKQMINMENKDNEAAN